MKIRDIKILSISILSISFINCESNLKEIQKNQRTTFVPTSEAEEFIMKYTDSAKIQAILESPKMKDFSALKFPFTEFPDGMNLTLFDKDGKKSYIKSDYAVIYSKSNIYDLRGNVKIISQDGKMLETSQLYYDSTNEWFFTEEECKFTSGPNNSFFAKGLDASSDLQKVNAQIFRGSGTLEK